MRLARANDCEFSVGNSTILKRNSHLATGMLKYTLTGHCRSLHYSKTAATAKCHIRSLAAVMPQCSRNPVPRPCNSLEISHLGHYTAMLTGLPKCLLRPLQLVLNMASCILRKLGNRVMSCLFYGNATSCLLKSAFRNTFDSYFQVLQGLVPFCLAES